ncbi:nitronate monooxygenase [Mesobacillus maritimus]|uniref:NAD(P)H-dependent flavin oxidoreductase n=1 Tax=Mesobacillus maritimus TaxID=1643336 RepID=UPI00203E5439|nr:nitronate monooxygenase [Mesobacillus maritimus]MCM3585846.1 nitronate monooxygenase [Mesobacillus maritimus]
MLKNELIKKLNLKYPIVQAPMAGGVTTSQLVAAVSNSGGLGMIGAGYLSPAKMRTQIQEIKELTPNMFGVNLFVPEEFKIRAEQVKSANQLLNPIRTSLNLPQQEQTEVPSFHHVLETFKEQIQVVIDLQVPVCSFTFGIPSKEIIAELKQQNIILIGTATTVREAIENEKAGMDIVVVQGSEAGGHRGSFIDEHNESLVGLMSLIPQVVDQVNIPVIAAGGIMDARGLMASLCLGAKGVQMGTAFLTCIESGAHPVHKEAILQAADDQTVITRAFSGKPARGIHNQFIADMQNQELEVAEFPIQNTLTQDIRKAASAQNNSEFMSLWSGQSASLAKKQTVEELMKSLIAEAKKLDLKF